MPESYQKLIERNRPPRVQITYDVETLGSIVTRELPFVVGVMADLSGKPEPALPPLKERKFVEVDRDNFDAFLKDCHPRLAMGGIPSKIPGETQPISVTLEFESMEDFGPLSILSKIGRLAPLYQMRQDLSDLIAKLDGNDVLDTMLRNDVAPNPERYLAAAPASPQIEAPKADTPVENADDKKETPNG
jgi:type VI secretion system ImpB/VipA family protein